MDIQSEKLQNKSLRKHVVRDQDKNENQNRNQEKRTRAMGPGPYHRP